MSWNTERLADALLVYASVSRKKPASLRDASKSMASLLVVQRDRQATLAEAVTRAVEELAEAGAIETPHEKRLRLTSEGTARCSQILGVKLPHGQKWSGLKKRLLAHALGPAEHRKTILDRLSQTPSAAGVIYNRTIRLVDDPAPTPTRVLDALVLAELGGEPTTKALTMKTIRALVLKRALGQQGPTIADPAKLLQTLTAKALGATGHGKAALEAAALRDWVGATQVPQNPEVVERVPAAAEQLPPLSVCDLPLSDFAARVLQAARHPEAVRFGPHKVFLSSVFDWYTRAQGGSPMWDDFAARLVEANSEGLIQLRRADLTSVMDPELVQRSEVLHETAAFHFVDLFDEESP